MKNACLAGDMGRGPSRTTLDAEHAVRRAALASERRLALVVIWWPAQPERLGEVLLPEREPAWFGRSAEGAREARLSLVRQRPGINEPAASVSDPFLSRRHLRVSAEEGCIAIACEGKRPLYVAGLECRSALLRPLDVVEVGDICSFLCVERPAWVDSREVAHEFGKADAQGMVGESPVLWELRRRVRFVANRTAHVLITGASGTGKKLAARAIHRLSARWRKPLVARNAATLPPSLLENKLFGNAPNYPDPGVAERVGLIGQADGSTLFLQEVGELSQDLHAHLLRVLDVGAYQRLGDARARAADLRLIAATQRAPSTLKEDLLARLALSLHVPDLNQRPEDIPLIARHLVQGMARQDRELGERFLLRCGPEPGEPRLSAELTCAITSNQYTTHVRELETLLWRSLQSSPAGVLECTPEVRELLRPRPAARSRADVSREERAAATH
jgi:sigma-54 interacting transcriptional regulator